MSNSQNLYYAEEAAKDAAVFCAGGPRKVSNDNKAYNLAYAILGFITGRLKNPPKVTAAKTSHMYAAKSAYAEAAK